MARTGGGSASNSALPPVHRNAHHAFGPTSEVTDSDNALPLQRSGPNMIVSGWSPADRVTVGVGLYAVPRSATANMQEARINPMKDPSFKTKRLPAVGVSFSF